MSASNVELTRRFEEAYNTRDAEAAILYCDPSVELHTIFAAVGGGVYRGHDGVRAFFRDMEDAWGDKIRVEREAYFDLGEHTLAYVVALGRGSQSGAEVAMPIASVARWRDGLMLYGKSYLHREDAVRDLGVTEHELEPIPP